jgi:hypothetical protein
MNEDLVTLLSLPIAFDGAGNNDIDFVGCENKGSSACQSSN